MAILSEADLAALFVTELRAESSDFDAQDAAVHTAVEEGIGTVVARLIRRCILDDAEYTIVANEMTGEDSAGDTPDSLTGPVVAE